MTPDATRRRAIGQILLLAAGFLVLVAISAASVILVNRAREDNSWVVHTVEVENQINTLLLEIRRAESAARGYLLTSEPRFLTSMRLLSPASLPTWKTNSAYLDNQGTKSNPPNSCARRSMKRLRRVSQGCLISSNETIPRVA